MNPRWIWASQRRWRAACGIGPWTSPSSPSGRSGWPGNGAPYPRWRSACRKPPASASVGPWSRAKAHLNTHRMDWRRSRRTRWPKRWRGSLREVEHAERVHPLVFLRQDIVEVQVEQAAERSEVEQRCPDFRLHDLAALRAHLAAEMRRHELAQVAEPRGLGEGLLPGGHRNAAAGGHRLGNGAVHARGGFGELALDVEDTSVAGEVLRDAFLEADLAGILHAGLLEEPARNRPHYRDACAKASRNGLGQIRYSEGENAGGLMTQVIIRIAGALLGAVVGSQVTGELVDAFPQLARGRIPLTIAGMLLGLLLGSLLAVWVWRWFERLMGWALIGLEHASLRDVALGAAGLAGGLIIAFLVGYPLSRIPGIGAYLALAAALVFGYLGFHVVMRRRE